ncbi:recombinase family protein [Geodermatophilus sp. SYSU D00705]
MRARDATTEAAPPRVALYLRQSQDTGHRRGDDEGMAVERQENRCRELAERRGWSVDPALIFVDNDVSASKSKPRPRWTALLRRIEAREVDVVIAWALDRLLRKPVELEHLIDLCEPLGVRVITVQGDLDFETPQGKLAARTFANMARFEADQKAARQIESEQQAVERGRPPRRRAFGYAKGGMAVEPAEASAVADAYRLLLAGTSLATIARRINERGLATTLGRPWEPTAVRTLLLNARNAGIRTYYGEEAGLGVWPAIVPEDTYRQAVAVLRDPARVSSGGSTARKHLGASLYRCGVCDAAGVDATVRTAYRESKVRIYVCGSARHLTRLADPIDDLVVRGVEKRLASPTIAEVLTADQPELTALHEQAAAVRARVRRIEADYGDGEITARVMREQIDRQTTELAKIDRQVAALTRSSRLGAVLSAKNPVAEWRALDDVAARQAVVEGLLRVVLLRGRPGRAPFDPETVRFDPPRR